MNIHMKCVASISFGICIVTLSAKSVFAWPSTSPSAKAAAKLKYHPPSGWINHYLPDDRFKISGGTWKYVSTEMDEYYHRPDSPLMLQQPAGIVIGFASAADAEEAGYRPAPSITWQDRQTGRTANSAPVAVRRPTQENTAASSDAPASGTISIPTSQIPKHILAFINLVDDIAGRIESTSSDRELLRIRVSTNDMERDFSKGVVALFLGGNRARSQDLAGMASILGMLTNAADEKREPGPVGFGLTSYKQKTSSARHLARAMIPQVKEMQSNQFLKSVEDFNRQIGRRSRSGTFRR